MYCRECAAPLKPSKEVSIKKTLKTRTEGLKKGTIIAEKY